jgi:hypothetical protein
MRQLRETPADEEAQAHEEVMTEDGVRGGRGGNAANFGLTLTLEPCSDNR